MEQMLSAPEERPGQEDQYLREISSQLVFSLWI